MRRIITNNRIFTIAICMSIVIGGLFGWISLSTQKVEADGGPYSESYQINLKTRNTTDTWVSIGYSVEDINWTINETEVCSVTIKLNKTDDMEKIIIHKVWVNVYSDFNFTTYKYDNFEKVMEIEPGDELYLVGDRKEYDFDITITNASDKLGLAAHVDITVTKPKLIEDDGSSSDDEGGKDEDNILNTSLFIGILVLAVVVVLVLMGLFLRKSKP